jgi:hypothetical protein
MKRRTNDASRLYWEEPEGAGNVLMRVEKRPFRQFALRIDRQLAALVDRWARPNPPSPQRSEFCTEEPSPK